MRLRVQRIDVIYTKASRGAPEATVRNRLPRAFALRAPASATYAFEHVVMQEPSFVPDFKPIEQADKLSVFVKSLAVEFTESTLKLGLVWDPSMGQPSRRYHRRALTLVEGQWARLSTNGRCSGYSGQWYTEVTFNVALGDPSDPEIFVTREPDQIFEGRADLF